MWPGIRTFFGQVYDEYDKKYPDIFTVQKSAQAYEEDVASSGFAFAQKKPEGGSFTYDSHNQEYVVRYTHDTWGLGYVVTMEELQDNLYQARSFKRARMLAFSMNQTKEVNGANILNNAFTGAVGGDGVTLGSLSHPTASGDQANMLATASDLSEASLEDTCIAISQIKTSRGLIFHALPELLIVHPNDMFNAERILNSPLQNFSASNAINALKSKGTLKGGYVVNPFLTSSTAWFVKTNVPDGLTLFERHELVFEQDNDFTTSNALAKSWERYSFGWSNWRSLWAAAGS